MTGTELTHHTRVAYYAQVSRLKVWQRFSLGCFIMFSSLAMGCWWEKQSEKRYSTFHGKTALYGSATTNPGWINKNQQ